MRHFGIKNGSRKAESDIEDSAFECYDESDGKPVHVEVDKEITGSSQKSRRLHCCQNRSGEEEINNNDKTVFGNDNRNGNTSVRRSNGKLKALE